MFRRSALVLGSALGLVLADLQERGGDSDLVARLTAEQE